MTQINMLEKVVAALEARTGDLRTVAAATGIPYDTILRVKNRENDPAFSRVAVLYAYFFPQDRFVAQTNIAQAATETVAVVIAGELPVSRVELVEAIKEGIVKDPHQTIRREADRNRNRRSGDVKG